MRLGTQKRHSSLDGQRYEECHFRNIYIQHWHVHANCFRLGKLHVRLLLTIHYCCILQRLGREGYKLFSEFMEEATPPATIRPSFFGSKLRFSIDGGSVAELESTPESAISQLHNSPIFRPSLVSR